MEASRDGGGERREASEGSTRQSFRVPPEALDSTASAGPCDRHDEVFHRVKNQFTYSTAAPTFQVQIRYC